MALSFRQTEILALARSEGRVVVEALAERFGVTLQTIRRDLTELAEAGHLDRVHGGAVLRSGVSNIGYEERRALHDAAKAAIGRACAQAIPDNCSMIVNLGTTTEAVAQALLQAPKVALQRQHEWVCTLPYAFEGLLRRECDAMGAVLIEVNHGSLVTARLRVADDRAAALRARLDEAGQGRLVWQAAAR